MMEATLKLTVNDIPIKTDHFVAGFVEHTIAIELNGKKLQTNVFASLIIKSTILGMLAPLKGVSDVKKVSIYIKN